MHGKMGGVVSLTLEAMLSEKLKLNIAHSDKRAGLLSTAVSSVSVLITARKGDGHSGAHYRRWFAMKAACRLTLPARMFNNPD